MSFSFAIRINLLDVHDVLIIWWVSLAIGRATQLLISVVSSYHHERLWRVGNLVRNLVRLVHNLGKRISDQFDNQSLGLNELKNFPFIK